MDTAITAMFQFADDYIMVVDNDFNAYTEIMEKQNTKAGNMSGLSDELREEFETYISQVVEREKENGHEVGALLISQMLIGWGASSFDLIAKHYLRLKTEAEGK
ncbi:hypothetical protein uvFWCGRAMDCOMC440_033 [Freshwater phage uvFW-CGR-AMD-COM-C440]|nr:hypothetical protein uvFWCGRAMDCOMC440_033 [Freshwater phage uvFW-CGR-AMD-COM-C440]